LVDATPDPQRSLAWWFRLRSAPTPHLVGCEARELPKIAEVARDEGVPYCIVDTPPHAENSIAAAMRVADLVLVSTRPDHSTSPASPRCSTSPSGLE
jgi:chromosome partitioning protein